MEVYYLQIFDLNRDQISKLLKTLKYKNYEIKSSKKKAGKFAYYLKLQKNYNLKRIANNLRPFIESECLSTESYAVYIYLYTSKQQDGFTVINKYQNLVKEIQSKLIFSLRLI